MTVKSKVAEPRRSAEGRRMVLKRRLTAGLGALLLSIGVGAFVSTTPAQAASLGNCPGTDFKAFCLYWDSDEVLLNEAYPGDLTRNKCTPVSFDDDSVWNATPTRWYLFHTGTCNGSHAEIAPNWAGRLPTGYNLGQTHAIMRTSTTS
jgi:hypothetical protein